MTYEQALTVPRPVKLTVDDFLLLDRAGAFASYRKTELIEGVIVALNPQHRPHGYAKDELAYRLRRVLEVIGSPLYVATEWSVAMPPESMPEPDITLSSAPRGEGPIPLPSVALIIEIADTTAAYDLDHKARAYGSNGVPEYWVVNLPDRTIHRFSGPEARGYSRCDAVPLGGRIAALTIDGLAIDTAGI